MSKYDTKDMIGGLALIGVGAYALYGGLGFGMGTARQMGPGYFPVVISGLLILFGLILLITSFTRHGSMPVISWRPTFAVLSSVLVFALALRTFGSIAALFGTVVVSSLAESESRLRETLLLAIGVSVGCWLLFSKGLGMNMPPFLWPF
jgi:Tripartite tricarboxylate transporter TctB family.